MTKKLPDKPSKLIEIALADLAKVEKSKKYKVDMTWYHAGSGIIGPECAVCFAGAVMAKTLHATITEDIIPDDYDEDTAQKLRAINRFRQGDLASAYRALERKMPFGLSHQIQVTSYEDNPAKFKREMAELAKTLKRLGE